MKEGWGMLEAVEQLKTKNMLEAKLKAGAMPVLMEME